MPIVPITGVPGTTPQNNVQKEDRDSKNGTNSYCNVKGSKISTFLWFVVRAL